MTNFSRRAVFLWLSQALLAITFGCSTGTGVVQKDASDQSDQMVFTEVVINTDGVAGVDLGDPLDLPESSSFEQWVFCAEEGGFGCPCEENDDCSSNWCVETPESDVCTISCIEECPVGWGCMEVQGGPDQVFMCLPYHGNLCRPCNEDADCGQALESSNHCLEFGGEGHFCGGYCDSEEGVDCPNGYACTEVTVESGATKQQCMPESDSCDCTPKYIELGLGTQCFAQNDFGKCFGQRYCAEDGLTQCDAPQPLAEACNLKDDDCNGLVDDAIDDQECEVTNDNGTCTGPELCEDGEWVCQAVDPTPEICDGQDNNCDGEVDEGSLDSDDDGVANCVDDDDDNDGLPDDQDNCSTVENPEQEDNDSDLIGDICDPDDDNDLVVDEEDCDPFDKDVHPGHPEDCDGKDNDCNGQIDEGLLDSDGDGISDCIDDDDDDDNILDFADNGQPQSDGLVGKQPIGPRL